jgi:hypothetical protein
VPPLSWYGLTGTNLHVEQVFRLLQRAAIWKGSCPPRTSGGINGRWGQGRAHARVVRATLTITMIIVTMIITRFQSADKVGKAHESVYSAMCVCVCV